MTEESQEKHKNEHLREKLQRVEGGKREVRGEMALSKVWRREDEE